VFVASTQLKTSPGTRTSKRNLFGAEELMRKQYKNKLRSCGLCKPHKRGWNSRWKPQQRQVLFETDREIRAVPRKAEQAVQPDRA